MIFKSEYPLNQKEVQKWLQKMNHLKETYFSKNPTYYTIIPDKNYYERDRNHLHLDYASLFDLVKTGVHNMSYIDFTSILSLQDYYKVDPHWRQERLQPIVDVLAQQMNFKTTNSYQTTVIPNFYGAYFGQSVIQSEPDTLIYLTNDAISQAIVSNGIDTVPVYDLSKLEGIDFYDLFLEEHNHISN